MSDKSAERSEMISVSEEASLLMRQLAEPAPAGAHIETLIRNIARKLGWSYSRAKDCWYRQARVIKAEEMDALRSAARAKAGPKTEEANAANRELHEIVTSIHRQLSEINEKLSRIRESS